MIWINWAILNTNNIQQSMKCQKLGKTIYSSNLQVTFELYSYLRGLRVFFAKQNYIYQVLAYSVDFKATQELWNPLNKPVTGTFHGSGRCSKRNYLQDRANFNRSRTRRIVLIFKTDNVHHSWDILYKHWYQADPVIVNISYVYMCACVPFAVALND